MKKNKLKKKVEELELRNKELTDDIYCFFDPLANPMKKYSIRAKYTFLIKAEKLLWSGNHTKI